MFDLKFSLLSYYPSILNDENINVGMLFYCKDSSYKFEVLSKALMVSSNESLKLKSLTEYLSRGFTPDNWNTFFSMLGEKYEGLNAIGEMYNVDSSPEAYEFMNALNSRGIVGKVKRIDNSYRAHVKKR